MCWISQTKSKNELYLMVCLINENAARKLSLVQKQK